MKTGHPISYLLVMFSCSSYTSSPHSVPSSSPFSFKFEFLSCCRINYKHCLQTQAHNVLAYSCVHIHSYVCVYVFISAYVFTCVCVYVNCIQACTCRCEGWAYVNQWLRAWIFSTSSLNVLVPMQFCNNLLLSHHTFFHAVFRVVSLENVC